MITSIATNSNNDIFLDSQSNLAFVNNIDAVLENCAHTMKAQLAEMIYAFDKGIPYFDTVWQKKNFAQFQGYARQALLAVNGVVKILSFTVEANGDVLSYQAVIETIYGVGSFDGQ